MMARYTKSDAVWERRQRFLRAYRVFGTYRKVAQWANLSATVCMVHASIARRDNPYPPSWPDPWTLEDARELANAIAEYCQTAHFHHKSAGKTFDEMIETTLRNHPSPDDPPSALYAWMKRGRAA